MNIQDLLPDFLMALGYNAPGLLILIVALAVTLVHWHRHPRAARWAALGFGWLLGTLMLSLAWRTMFVVEFFPNNPPLDPLEFMSYLFFSLSEGLASIFLLTAFVVALTPHRPRRHFDEYD